MKTLNQIGIVVLILITLFASGCTDSQPQRSQTQSEEVAQTATPSAIEPRSQKYNIQDDIPPRSMINYTNIFKADSDQMPDKVTVYATITANLGTMVEIVDKDDMGCLDVVNSARGTQMSSGRYLFAVNCTQQLDPESTTVIITNPDDTTPISYMLQLIVTEVIPETKINPISNNTI